MTTIDPAQVEVRSAATVMLVRDGDEGLEVFMLRRNPASVFAGGAFVFPGGAVDPDDTDPHLESLTAGLTDGAASATLGLEAGGLAYWVAAIRECFEESGLLLAYDRSRRLVPLDDPEVDQRFAAHRHTVDRGELSLAELCAREQLTLACDAIHYVSRWVTPVGPPRRYDTRFFVARAPDAQVGVHDDRETVANRWVTPSRALQLGEAGEIDLHLPTAHNLEALSRFDSVTDVLASVDTLAEPRAVRPRVLDGDGEPRIVLPGDPGYEGAAS